jgi:aspartate kinase
MEILKFGGTSVGSSERMKDVAKLVNYPGKKIVVLSAMSGTTDSLVKITKTLSEGAFTTKGDQSSADWRTSQLLKELEAKYRDTVEKLYSTKEYKNKGNEIITEHFNLLWSFTLDMFTPNEEKTILAEGELLSTALVHYYLEEQKIASVLLPALNFMRIDENGEPDLDYIEEHLKKELAKHPQSTLFITQGYICRNTFGQVDNLKRGGSDYTASLIGAAIYAKEIQIWTDIDGMHNNDPRYVPNTFPIAELSFDEAAELAYFGAKILHPYCIRPAKKRDVPVRLLNTMEPKAKGTLISRNASGDDIKAVAAKDGITVINIKSTRMLMAYGFLRSIFEVFERYKTPIDMITTSEVAVSLTIDDLTHLDEIMKELEAYGTVDVEINQVIICIVGDFLADKHGYAVRIFESLRDVPLRMISYGGSKNNISVLVNAEHKKEALLALNRGLFTKNK